MNKEICKDMVKYFNLYCEEKYQNFDVKQLSYEEKIKFHQWVDNKENFGIFKIYEKNQTLCSDTYYFVFIDWKETENYYLVVYPEKKTGPLIELNKITVEKDLLWRYSPTKRDGNNNKRKQYFEKYYGNINTRIRIPENKNEVEAFISDVIELVTKRIKADNLDEITPTIRNSFPEGRTYEKRHKKRERNLTLIEYVKKKKLSENGKLFCEVCEFNFFDKYGEIGQDFIEAHHTIPVSELDENSTTNVEDIVLVCSNCHSMLHRKRPWLSIDEIKKIIKQYE